MPTIIGLNGDSQSGKSTVAEMLEDKGFYRYSLTMGIVRYIRERTDILETYFKGVENETDYRKAYDVAKAIHGSELFIKYGKEMREGNGPQAVSISSIPYLEDLINKYPLVVIDDLRVGDDILKEHFENVGVEFKIVRVEGKGHRLSDLDVELPFDYKIENNSTLESLVANVNQMLANFGV